LALLNTLEHQQVRSPQLVQLRSRGGLAFDGEYEDFLANLEEVFVLVDEDFLFQDCILQLPLYHKYTFSVFLLL